MRVRTETMLNHSGVTEIGHVIEKRTSRNDRIDSKLWKHVGLS